MAVSADRTLGELLASDGSGGDVAKLPSGCLNRLSLFASL
jgi:hypothetical protein